MNINLKKIGFFAISGLLMMSCSNDDLGNTNIENIDSSQINNNISQLNQRVEIVNEPIVFNSNSEKSEADFENKTLSTNQANACSSCDTEITTHESGTLNINQGESVCITSSGSFTGRINVNRGTLSICGNAQLTGLNINSGSKVIINENANFALASHLNINGNAEFYNYSSAPVNISGHLNNNSYFESHGPVNVSGHLNNNGNSDLIVTCSLNVAGNLNQNANLNLDGYLRVNGKITFNGSSLTELNSGSLISTERITVNSTIKGLGNAYSKIDVENKTVINGSGKIKGNIDLCDANGIDRNYGHIDQSVTFCEAYIPSRGSCVPSSGEQVIPDFTLVANVTAPENSNGQKLSATSIQVLDNYAYVSWHLNANPNDYEGVLDIYNISDAENPQLISSFTSTEIDFNHLYVDESTSAENATLWATGSRKSNSNLNSPAILAQFELVNNTFVTQNFNQFDLPSFSGNSVIKANNTIYSVSGNTDGAITSYEEATQNLQSEISMDGLKYIDTDNAKLIVLKQGQPNAEVSIYNLPVSDFNSPERVIQVGAINPIDGKNVARISNNKIYVATGDNGLKVFDLNQNSPIHTYNSNLSGLTNAVAADHDLIYVAHGQSGLHILNANDYSFIIMVLQTLLIIMITSSLSLMVLAD